jgi:SAM-dependent methyltransferase
MSAHLRARAYSYLRRARGPQRWRSACLYLGAGLLRISEFRSPSIARWEAYHDERDGLVTWEDELYRAVMQPSDRVLLIGCGTGRDLLALRQMGCDVTGLEQSAALAEAARATLSRHELPTVVIAEAIESYDSHDTFDVIVFSPYTYSYIVGMAARVGILGRLRERLSDRGKVIISYPRLRPQSSWWIFLARVSSVCARSDWWPEAGDRLYGPASIPTGMDFEHQFSPDELAHECRLAGLHIVRDGPISSYFRFAVAAV